MLQHFFIQFPPCNLWSLTGGRKQKEISNFQLLKWSQSLTRGGRLQEVPDIVI